MKSQELPKGSFYESAQRVREELLKRLEEIVTDPNSKYDIPVYVYEDIMKEKRVMLSMPLYEIVNQIGSDLNINHQQLVGIRQELFIE